MIQIKDAQFGIFYNNDDIQSRLLFDNYADKDLPVIFV